MRCAQPRTLPSSNLVWDVAIAAGFLLGLALFVISSAMLRTASRAPGEIQDVIRPITWTKLVDDELTGADAQLRLDMIERLSLVPGDWSRSVLEQAKTEETDPQLAQAIENALQRV